MTPDDILNQHVALCDETYEVLNDENSALKNQGKFNKAQIERKKELLRRLDDSLDALKRLNRNPHSKTSQTNQLIDRAQKRLMQIFLLDRENERLLNKGSGTTTASNRDIRKRNLSTYAENAAQAEQAHEEPIPFPTESEAPAQEGDYEEEGYYEEEEYYAEDYPEESAQEEKVEEQGNEDGYAYSDEEYYEEESPHSQNAYPDYDEDSAPPTPPPQPSNPPRKLPRAYRQHIQDNDE